MTRLTAGFLCKILLKGGRISPEQAREKRAKQDAQRMKLLKARGETLRRGRMHIENEVSAIEVAASLNLETPGASYLRQHTSCNYAPGPRYQFPRRSSA